MSDLARIPSFGLARGAVVSLAGGGPNMLVVRGLDEITAVIVIEGDKGGAVRLREVRTADLVQMLPARTPIDSHQPMIPYLGQQGEIA